MGSPPVVTVAGRGRLVPLNCSVDSVRLISPVRTALAGLNVGQHVAPQVVAQRPRPIIVQGEPLLLREPLVERRVRRAARELALRPRAMNHVTQLRTTPGTRLRQRGPARFGTLSEHAPLTGAFAFLRSV